jgi:hypothetical protein
MNPFKWQTAIYLLGLGIIPLALVTLNQIAPLPQPVSAKPKPAPVMDRNSSYLIIGDSLIEGGVGTELENRLRINNVRLLKRQGKQSTGLLHPDRMDWFKELDIIFSEQKYDVVIIMFGLNDLADISENGTKYILGTPEWQVVYSNKVDQMVQKIFGQGRAKKLIWLGAPIAPDNYKYAHINNANIQMINNLYRATLGKYPNTIFIDTYPVYTVNGRWTQEMYDFQGVLQRVRTQDGIHITYEGGRIMTEIVLQVMRANSIRLF